ncbi:MAG: SGNH/GDSL hydrolase family protein [bacterium]
MLLNFLKTTLLLVLSIVITLVLGEFLVRLALKDITSTSNMQTWFGVRWKENYVTYNSLGYREREFGPEKEADTYRIIMLGDSFGFGQGLPIEERFSHLIEEALIESGMKAEVLNIAFPGAASLDHLLQLEEVVLPNNPDFILIQWLPNDFQHREAAWAAIASDKTASRRIIKDQRSHRKAMRKSALYFLVNTQYAAVIEALDDNINAYDYNLLLPFEDPGSELYAETLQPLLDLLAALEASGVDYAIALHPMLTPDLLEDYPLGQLHELVLVNCDEANSPCFDAADKFRSLEPDTEMSSLWVNRFDPHPGAAANKIFAEFILEEIGPAAWGYPAKP